MLNYAILQHLLLYNIFRYFCVSLLPIMLCNTYILLHVIPYHTVLYHLICSLICNSVLDPEQKAIQDGRIGSEVVIVDPTSQCGNMRVEKERIEVARSN